MVSNSKIKEADEEFTPDTYDDRYLNMELAVPRGDNPNPQYARVTKRLRDADGVPIGTANENPILDSRMYEVEYQDGTKVSLAANYIAENLFAQVDQEGNRHVSSKMHSSRQALDREGGVKPPLGGSSWHNGKTEV